jgi:hypothetical protein
MLGLEDVPAEETDLKQISTYNEIDGKAEMKWRFTERLNRTIN